MSPVLVIAVVTLLALVALGAFVTHVMRAESAAWRALLATVVTSPVMVDHVHRVHDETVRDARRLIKVATIGREEPAPTRRVQGSPPPEVRASRVIQDESVAAMALRVQALYREADVIKPLGECVREAQAMLAGELAG